jgi:DNA-binding response OmpR family regulator
MTHEGSTPTQIDVKRPGEVVGAPLADTFVVLVERDDDAREFLAALLGLHGAIVVSAGSDDEALELVETGTANVLVVGAGAIETDRLSLIRQVRAAGRGWDVPALALTCVLASDTRSEALAAGYQECLAWPFAAGDLVRTACRIAEKG